MRFVVFDGWRGVCALFIALYHFGAYGHFYHMAFVRHSFLFVDFFFVLSGFVMSYAYLEKLQDWPDAIRFMIRRFGRLWPLHVAMIIVLLLPEAIKLVLTRLGNVSANTPAFSDSTSVLSLVTNFLLMHSLGVHDRLTWNFPSWAVSTEFYTYVVFCFFCVLVPRKPAVVRKNTSILMIFATGLIVAAFSKTFVNTTYSYGFARCVYGFFFGFLVYNLYRSDIRFSGWLEIPTVIVISAFVVLLGDQVWSIAAPLVFGFALLVFSSAAGPISRLMLTRPFVLLGTLSYSLYMVHWVLFSFIARLTTFIEKISGITLNVIEDTALDSDGLPTKLLFFGSKWIMDASAILYLGVVIVVASITYQLIEEPGRRFFNRLADKTLQLGPVPDSR